MRLRTSVVVLIAACASACGGPTTAPTFEMRPPAAVPPVPTLPTPPDPTQSLISGTVREVNGGPLAGVEVRNRLGARTLTNAAGEFSVTGGMPDDSGTSLSFEKHDFSYVRWVMPGNFERNPGPIL